MDNGQPIEFNEEAMKKMQDAEDGVVGGVTAGGCCVSRTHPYDLNFIFTYQPASEEQLKQYQAIREAARNFATVLFENSPRCADQVVAFRRIREAVMNANAAIALKGAV